MGNKSGKHEQPKQSTDSLLSDEELESLSKFHRMSQRCSTIIASSSSPAKDRLKDLWKYVADDYVLRLYCSYLHKDIATEKSPFDGVREFFCKLTKSPCHESAEFIISILRHNDYDISYNTILLYVTSIITSYLKMILYLKDDAFMHWKKLGIQNSETVRERYAQFLCQGLERCGVVEIDFGKWFSECPQFQKLQAVYVYKLFHVSPPPVTYKHQMVEKLLMPSLFQTEKLHKGSSFSILDMTDILFLNSVLPEESQFEWELCFSSVLHGQGFGKLVRCITNKGPTLVIIKDKGGHIFGGYATDSWTTGPNFHGNSESFLFKLNPDMIVYETTDYNNHYQYLNQQQQTMPNGLGMGGQFEYFGFWLDSDYGTGHCSESCSTYKNYKMLSSTKKFLLEHVEVWAVTVPEKEDEDLAVVDRSILDKDSGAKAMLELAGKPMASAGYRDRPNEPLE